MIKNEPIPHFETIKSELIEIEVVDQLPSEMSGTWSKHDKVRACRACGKPAIVWVFQKTWNRRFEKTNYCREHALMIRTLSHSTDDLKIVGELLALQVEKWDRENPPSIFSTIDDLESTLSTSQHT